MSQALKHSHRDDDQSDPSHLEIRELMRALGYAFLLTLTALSSGAETTLERRVEELEERLEKIDREETDATSAPESLASRARSATKRFHLSGNGDVNYLYGENNSRVDHGRFALENARFFLDVDLGGTVDAWGTVPSLYVEWDLVREAELKNDVGSAHLRLDTIFDRPWLNAKLGRFPIPFGEEYLRFHEQRPQNPLISFSAASPYGFDEGLLLFGSLGRSGEYLLAVTDGDDGLGQNSAAEPAVTLKLLATPRPWLQLSASAHRAGELGPTDEAPFGLSALEIGSFGAYPMKVPSSVIPIFQDGLPIDADPSAKLNDFYAFEGNVTLSGAYGRLWLSYGRAFIDAQNGSSYDRDLHYWVAEGVFELGSLSELLGRAYVAARYSAIGTFDDGKGWRLFVMNDGGNLGYNVDEVHLVSGGIGFRINRHVVFKTEYSWWDFSLVRGATPALRSLARNRNYFGAGFSVGF